MTKAQAASLAAVRVPVPDPEWQWDPTHADNGYDPCADLSWVALPLQSSTISSPWGIALFHDGTYLGTTTKEAYGFMPGIIRESDGAITVNYAYPRPGEANVQHSGVATAHFRWDPALNRVVMTGHVPPQ